jgi:hypothetical protein
VLGAGEAPQPAAPAADAPADAAAAPQANGQAGPASAPALSSGGSRIHEAELLEEFEALEEEERRA